MPDGLDRLVYTWPEGEPMPDGQTRAYASSMRLEAMVQSVNDYEYMRILEQLAEKAGPNSQARRHFDQLLSEAQALLSESGLGGGTIHNVDELQIFDVEPVRLTIWKERVGEAIERASRP